MFIRNNNSYKLRHIQRYMKERARYLGVLLLFPLFFTLHGFNENFALVPLPVVLKLLGKYCLVTVACGVLSYLVFRNNQKAFIFSTVLLSVYFFFGASKDFVEAHVLKTKLPYRYLLPCLPVFLFIAYLLVRRIEYRAKRLADFFSILIVVFFILDLGILLFNILAGRAGDTDMGDRQNLLFKQAKLTLPQKKPTIFWIVVDEYTSAESLKKGWAYTNPLDSILKDRGFFIADSATSNYNYTHYSIASTLDMVYIRSLKNHSVITLADLVKGNISLYENNVVKILKSLNYRIENFSIYDLKEHNSKAWTTFSEVPESLIDNQVLFTRINDDLGWNFPNIFKRDKRAADSMTEYKINQDLDRKYRNFHKDIYEAIREDSKQYQPTFFLIHDFIAHEPFIYKADGTLHARFVGLTMENYLDQLKYANTLLMKMIDSVLTTYSDRELVIILQGDHGFKFEEDSPLFESESCKILYAVYYSQKKYDSWYPSVSSVNGFRILLNDYFQANLPLLPDSSYNLYYR